MQHAPVPSTHGPFGKSSCRMDKQMYIPSTLVYEHMPELANIPYGKSMSIQVQLVLLPPHASDVTPESPAMEVIQLNYGVTVRKSRTATDTGSFNLAGIALTCSKPAKKAYIVTGAHVISIAHSSLSRGNARSLPCTPPLPGRL